MPPLLVLISRLYVSTTMPKRCCKVIKKKRERAHFSKRNARNYIS